MRNQSTNVALIAAVLVGVGLKGEFLLAEEYPIEIHVSQAAAHEGREVRVRFYVRSIGGNPHGDFVELYSEAMWDHPRNLMVRITPTAQAAMRDRGDGHEIGSHFEGRVVRVRGVMHTVTFGDREPQPAMYVESEDQIDVVRPKEYEIPVEEYETVSVVDATLRISPEIGRRSAEKRQQLIDLLTRKLSEIKETIPAEAYESLKGTVFWANWDVDQPGMAYHPHDGFLRRTGIPAEYHRCVEIRNVQHFLDWTTGAQPWAVLHELAHKYHHDVVGRDNELIRNAFQAATESGQYRRVRHIDGYEEVAYAATNPEEYFAELTEAYFGKNDFFPFDRAELIQHDPTGFEMIETLWGLKSHGD